MIKMSIAIRQKLHPVIHSYFECFSGNIYLIKILLNKAAITPAVLIGSKIY